MTDTTNPKDALASRKTAVGLWPAAGTILGARALEQGVVKYGAYNWRVTNVRMTVYLDAMERHLLALRDGEDAADDSGVSHLGHILASAAILADAWAAGTLIDDRPPPGPAAALLKHFEATDGE